MDEEERAVALAPLGKGPDGFARFEAVVAGRPLGPLEARLEGDLLLLRVAGKVHRVIREAPGGPSPGAAARLYLRGEAFEVEARRGAGAAGARGAGAHASRLSVRSPMPGRVIAVRVRAGDRVERGDLLLILEAMKMQNEFASPTTGRVVEVKVAPGQVAAAGDVLVVVEAGP